MLPTLDASTCFGIADKAMRMAELHVNAMADADKAAKADAAGEPSVAVYWRCRRDDAMADLVELERELRALVGTVE